MKGTASFSSIIFKAATPLLFVLTIWAVLSFFFESWILPSPLETFQNIDALLTLDFIKHWQASIFRIALGASISFLLGTSIAIIAIILNITKFTESLHTMGQTLPAVVVSIIFLLIFGTGNTVPIVLIITMVTPFIAVQTSAALNKPEPLLKLVIKSHGGSKKELIRDLYIPKLIPTMRATMILATTMGVKVCILGEFIGSENGIGFLLNVARLYMNMNEVLFYVAVILLQMFFFQIFIDVLFRSILKKYFFPN